MLLWRLVSGNFLITIISPFAFITYDNEVPLLVYFCGIDSWVLYSLYPNLLLSAFHAQNVPDLASRRHCRLLPVSFWISSPLFYGFLYDVKRCFLTHYFPGFSDLRRAYLSVEIKPLLSVKNAKAGCYQVTSHTFTAVKPLRFEVSFLVCYQIRESSRRRACFMAR